MDPHSIAQRYLGTMADLRGSRFRSPTPDERQWAMQAVQQRFNRDHLRQTLQTLGVPLKTADPATVGQTGYVGNSTDPLYTTATESIQQQIITGGYFNFPQSPDASGELWGNIGEGPLGYNWNINGSPIVNPYIPAYFGDQQPPVLNFPPAFSRADFESRHLFGFEALLQQWPGWPQAYERFYHQAVDAVEAAFGGFIYPRLILTDGMERGFIPGTDFDLEEREYDFCQPAGEWVLTPQGYRPIETLRPGDMVLTHTGQWAPIRECYQRPYHGTMHTIWVAGLLRPVRMTHDHPVWSYRDPAYKQRKTQVHPVRPLADPDFRPAEALRVGDVVRWPIDQTVLSPTALEAAFIAACGDHAVYESTIGTRDAQGRIRTAQRTFRPLRPEEVPFIHDPRFWRLVGYFLGDGTVKPSGIILTLGSTETAEIQEVMQIAETVLGRRATVTVSPSQPSCVRIQISCAALSGFFRGLYHTPPGKRHHAAHKQIYPWMEWLPLDAQRELLAGYFLTDGYRNAPKPSPTYQITSVSRPLLEAIQRIGWRLGIAGTLKQTKGAGILQSPSNGKRYPTAPAYTYSAGPDFGRIVLGHDTEQTRRPSARQTWVQDGFVYAQIRQIDREAAAETVYSFQVDHPDHSYTGYGIATHNCATEFYNWGWTRLRYTPLMAILNMTLVYPTGQMILQFPPSWIKPQMLSGEIRLVPPQGAISQIVLGPGGYLVMLIGGTLTDMPALIFVDYIAGMWPIPQLLVRAIELRLALMVFPILSDAVARGRADVVTSVDGIQHRQLFTTRSDVMGLSGRINQYTAEFVTLIRQARARFLGTIQTKKFTAM